MCRVHVQCGRCGLAQNIGVDNPDGLVVIQFVCIGCHNTTRSTLLRIDRPINPAPVGGWYDSLADLSSADIAEEIAFDRYREMVQRNEDDTNS